MIRNLHSDAIHYPTGKVVTATITSNLDLFFNIKGGGNNFGILMAITYNVV